MSEDKYHEVYIDTNPELWDVEFQKDNISSESLKALIADYEANYIRTGKCKKCGLCCYIYERDLSLVPCKHLLDNGDGTFDCALYETPERPQICVKYPQKDNLYKYPDCGYTYIQK